MERLEFEEENTLTRTVSSASTQPFLVRWMIRKGLAKEEKHANYIVLGFVIVMIIASLFLFLSGDEDANPPFEGGSNPQFIE